MQFLVLLCIQIQLFEKKRKYEYCFIISYKIYITRHEQNFIVYIFSNGIQINILRENKDVIYEKKSKSPHQTLV